MRASQNGHHEVVRTLLEAEAYVNDKTNVRNQKMILMMMILMIVLTIMMMTMIIVINDEDRDEDDRISMYWC